MSTASKLALLLAACATVGRVEDSAVFTRATPLASNAEIARRALPPRAHARLANIRMADQAIDLARERFDVFVPSVMPAKGYGLIVYVAPWNEPTRPRAWRGELERRGLVFVSAQRSGNGESTLDRRLPLALLGYANVAARFQLDPARVYIAGFSGGGRVAEIAALAYPDIFRGALLQAGADPIDGTKGMYQPPIELLPALQHTRFVLITGEKDQDIQRDDDLAERSLKEACILDVADAIAVGLGHESLDAISFHRALELLEQSHVDEAARARCNARVDRELADKRAAGADPNWIDAHYGGRAI